MAPRIREDPAKCGNLRRHPVRIFQTSQNSDRRSAQDPYPGRMGTDLGYVELRFYGDLAALSGTALTDLPVGEPRSVKDAIEAVGVPHPEVALILVDHEPVGFDRLVRGGERIAVFPPFHSLELAGVPTVFPAPVAPRFLLDVHLGTLARRLRQLGFDCWYRTDADDPELARVAVDEQRILLTRDRQLLMRREIAHGYCPRSSDPDEQALEVVRRYRLYREVAPHTRCVNCNGLLYPVAKADVSDQLPPATRAAFDDYARCDGCGQVYWPGSHLEALEGFLDRVTAATPGP